MKDNKDLIIESIKKYDSEQETVSKVLFDVYPDEMQELCNLLDKRGKIIQALEEYIELLSMELNEVAPLARAHGWSSDRYEAGSVARKKIQDLK